MFRVSQHPSSAVLKTVPAASGTGHTTCTATPFQRGLIGTHYTYYTYITLITYCESVFVALGILSKQGA